MNNIFFTADNHFSHRNIALYCMRSPWIYDNPDYDPTKQYHFKFNNSKAVNIKAHDEALIENWNKVVNSGDIVYILGDFAFKDHNHYLMALHGKKILILGNHDKASQIVYNNFTEVHEFGCRKRIEGYDITLCHYALRTWASSCHNSFSLFGHSHGRMPEFNNMLSFDVGVDVWGYAPIPWEVVLEKMTQKMEWVRKNGKVFVDGESRADGLYDKHPSQRVIDTRMKNKEIMIKMGCAIDEIMWPASLPIKNACQRENIDD